MDKLNRKLTEEEFFKERKEVLSGWPTGQDVDLDEAIAYHKSLPPGKVWAKKMQYAKEHGEIYAITGMGVATIEGQIELLQCIEREGQADLLGTSVDSYSRQSDYEAAEKGIKDSKDKGRSVLNGLPVVNHGVKGFRKIMDAVNLPISMRYGAADTRLIDEIGYAGGHTSGPADALMDFWHHHSKVSLEKVLNTHRYGKRLIGYYEEHGVPMLASCQGLYGAGIPPTLQVAAIIVQLFTLAEQGVKNMRLHFATHGDLVQDATTSRVLTKLADEYLKIHGYKDINIYLSVSFSLVQYPLEPGTAFAVSFMNTLMAKVCNAQSNDIRTIAEAKGIPKKEDTAYTFRTVKAMENFLQGQKIEMNQNDLDLECKMAELEVRAIVDKVLEFGDGDAVSGILKAVETGVLDNPFATNSASPCKVMGIKDSRGAIRYLNHGNLPFTNEILDYQTSKINDRENKKKKKLDYEDLVSDLMAVSKGFLVE
ncbi:MAG: methylaspartate mutase subunit E [Spirochaetes bacterium]|nr:methylaspartate mutase subunit E [Spirochaetota bacterium]